MKKLVAVLAIVLFVILVPQLVSAGGGLISTEVYPNSGWENFNVTPGEQFIVKPQVHLDNADSYDQTIRWCVNCPIKVKLENPQPNDVINQSSDKTDENGQIYAKVISHIEGVRYVYSEVTLPNGEVYTGSKNSLNYAPTYIYGTEPTVVPKPVPSVQVPTVRVPVSPSVKVESTKAVYSTPSVVVTEEKTASLEAKVNQLEQDLAESKKRQNVLERRLNDLISWIKSLFS